MPHVAGSVPNQEKQLRKHNTSPKHVSVTHTGTVAFLLLNAPKGGGLIPLTHIDKTKPYIFKCEDRRVSQIHEHSRLLKGKEATARQANTGRWKTRKTPHESHDPSKQHITRDHDETPLFFVDESLSHLKIPPGTHTYYKYLHIVIRNDICH